jgi:thiol-disulfide isomerase/thioredoxin
MKLNYTLLVCLVALAFRLAAAPPAPFTLNGNIKNARAGKMMFFFKDPSQGYKDYTIEEVDIDQNGNFILVTSAITAPVRATLRYDSLSLDLFAAPGYNLTLEANPTTLKNFHLNKKISGMGAQPNRYLFRLDSADWAVQGKGWYELDRAELMQWIARRESRLTKEHQQAFAAGAKNDPWLTTFSKMATIDRQAMSLFYLLSNIMSDTTLTYAESVKLFKANANPQFVEHLYDNENLLSMDYQGWLMGTYAIYLRTLAIRQDRNYKNSSLEDFQLLDQVLKYYKNDIREVRLYAKMHVMIEVSGSLEALNTLTKRLAPYMEALKDKADRERLQAFIAETARQFSNALVGTPAPEISATDTLGQRHSLHEFKGKVVYIDLWASWCGPCKEQQPHLKALMAHYRSQKEIVFLCLAVLDKEKNWIKSVRKEKIPALQWYDVQGDVQKFYHVNAIPRFIIIGKEGELVSLDAPLPSHQTEVIALLDKALAEPDKK